MRHGQAEEPQPAKSGRVHVDSTRFNCALSCLPKVLYTESTLFFSPSNLDIFSSPSTPVLQYQHGCQTGSDCREPTTCLLVCLLSLLLSPPLRLFPLPSIIPTTNTEPVLSPSSPELLWSTPTIPSPNPYGLSDSDQDPSGLSHQPILSSVRGCSNEHSLSSCYRARRYQGDHAGLQELPFINSHTSLLSPIRRCEKHCPSSAALEPLNVTQPTLLLPIQPRPARRLSRNKVTGLVFRHNPVFLEHSAQ